jgi:uncharacterized protein YdhG (YjbR/CyaY superfamily)
MQPDPRIDAYLAKLPEAQRTLLGKLHARVHELAPEVEDTISYGMPAFRLDGRFLLSYAGWKRHCSIYPIDDALLARHEATIGGYPRTKGSLHFSEDRPLPDELLADIVRRRVDGVRGGSGY